MHETHRGRVSASDSFRVGPTTSGHLAALWRGKRREIPGAPARDIIKGPVAGILRAALLVLPMLGGCSINKFQRSEWSSDWVDVSSDAIFPWQFNDSAA